MLEAVRGLFVRQRLAWLKQCMSTCAGWVCYKVHLRMPTHHMLYDQIGIETSGNVANAGSTKREPTVVGKPAEFMLANIAETFGLRRDQICMVGDRLDTDILFGQHGGLTTMLVLSGEPRPTHGIAAHVCHHA